MSCKTRIELKKELSSVSLQRNERYLISIKAAGKNYRALLNKK